VALVYAYLTGGRSPAVPDPAVAQGFKAEALSKQQAPLTVQVRALTSEESRRYFGGSLKPLGIQPLWLQVRNDADTAARYLPILTDPDYFAPQEVAQQLHGWFSGAANQRLDALFAHTTMPGYLPPHSQSSGFVYTHADGGLKFVNVSIIAEQQLLRFQFALTIPGREYAVQRVDFAGLYRPEQIEDLTLEQLRARLESQPCCVRDKAGQRDGDPLNLVFIGAGTEPLFAFTGRGWRLNEPQDARSSLEMAKAFLLHSQYDTAPVSPLYLFGRFQDMALQKARSSVSRRDHLRVWLAPFTVEHQRVWMGQISRDIGIKLTTQTWYLTTHRISPYVDQERDYLLQDLAMSGVVKKVGFVKGVGASEEAHPRRNLTDDPYYTDGLRLVVQFGSELTLPSKIELLPWERPPSFDRNPMQPPGDETR
jgi:LssY C-terminus